MEAVRALVLAGLLVACAVPVGAGLLRLAGLEGKDAAGTAERWLLATTAGLGAVAFVYTLLGLAGLFFPSVVLVAPLALALLALLPARAFLFAGAGGATIRQRRFRPAGGGSWVRGRGGPRPDAPCWSRRRSPCWSRCWSPPAPCSSRTWPRRPTTTACSTTWWRRGAFLEAGRIVYLAAQLLGQPPRLRGAALRVRAGRSERPHAPADSRRRRGPGHRPDLHLRRPPGGAPAGHLGSGRIRRHPPRPVPRHPRLHRPLHRPLRAGRRRRGADLARDRARGLAARRRGRRRAGSGDEVFRPDPRPGRRRGRPADGLAARLPPAPPGAGGRSDVRRHRRRHRAALVRPPAARAGQPGVADVPRRAGLGRHPGGAADLLHQPVRRGNPTSWTGCACP